MRKIIVNSTPLIALAKANKLEILKGMYEHIIIPEAVYREVTEKDDVAAQRIEAAREWIEVRKVDSNLDRRMYKAKLHDGEVEVHAIAVARGGERLEQVLDFLEGGGGIFALHGAVDFLDALAAHEVIELLDLRFAEASLGEGLGECLGADFQAAVQHRVHECWVRCADFFEVGGQELAARDANRKFVILQAELAQHGGDGGHQVGLGVDAFCTDDVHVQLEELAQAALLGLFVTEKARHGEPLEGLLDFAGLLDYEARKRRRHFGSERNLAVALVLEVVELAHDFFAGLARVQLQVLEHRAFVFFVGETFGGTPPGVKNVVLDALGFRVKIARALGQLGYRNAHSGEKFRK